MEDSMKLAAMAREIGQLAPLVGKEHAEQQDAFHQQHLAEVRLLTSLVSMAKPGLPAISGFTASLGDGVPTGSQRGVLLHEGKDRDDRPIHLYLLEDGKFWRVWTRYDEALDMWAEESVSLDIDKVVQKYDVAPMIATLHALLAKQAGKRKDSTAQAREAAAKMNAIMTLLDAAGEVPVRQPEGVDAFGEDIPF